MPSSASTASIMRTEAAERLGLARQEEGAHAEGQAGLEVQSQAVGVAVEEAVRGSGSAGPRRRPSCRSRPRPGEPPARRPRAPWRRPRASARQTRSRRSRRRRRRARGRGRGLVAAGGAAVGAERCCGNRPGGSAAHWRPWCLLLVGAPSAGEAGCGAKKSPLHTGSGPGAVARVLRSTRSLPWSGRY